MYLRTAALDRHHCRATLARLRLRRPLGFGLAFLALGRRPPLALARSVAELALAPDDDERAGHVHDLTQPLPPLREEDLSHVGALQHDLR